jgi:L-2-hydroxyglutarate oxidase LhgO
MENSLEWFLEKFRKRLNERQIKMIEHLNKIGNFDTINIKTMGPLIMSQPNTAVFLYGSGDMKLEFTIEF